jgi:hypothetical protein
VREIRELAAKASISPVVLIRKVDAGLFCRRYSA